MSQTIGKIILWIILLFVLVIVIMWIGRVAAAVQQIDPELISCAEQIKNHARYVSLAQQDRVGVVDRLRPPSIACPTQERTYKGSEQQILDGIAQNMKACHDLWNGGDHLLFDTDGIYCHVCTLSTIDHDNSITGLEEYLLTQPPNNPYFEQMIPGVRGEQMMQDVREADISPAVLEPGVEYATIFYYARGQTALEIFEKRLISEDSFVKGGIFGAGVGAGIIGCMFGWPVCIGAVPAALLATPVAIWLYETPPEYASSILFLEWDRETVRSLGCEYSFVERTN